MASANASPTVTVPAAPVAAKPCRFASADMLRAYRHLPCLVNRFRIRNGATVAQMFESIRVIRNPPPPATNNAAERQWQSCVAAAVHPTIDSIIHGARGATRPRFAYQHQPWAPVAESTVATALRDYARTLIARPAPVAPDRQLRLEQGPAEATAPNSGRRFVPTARQDQGQGRHYVVRSPPHAARSDAPAAPSFSFELDTAAIRAAVDSVLQLGANTESMHLPASRKEESFAPVLPEPNRSETVRKPAVSGNERAKLCASVAFLLSPSGAPLFTASESQGYHKSNQMRRCFLSQRKFGGFAPCAGECVVVETRPTPCNADGPATAAAQQAVTSADAAAIVKVKTIGVMRSVSSWSRRKSGGMSLTSVCRRATIADVSHHLAAEAALMSLPNEIVVRLVVATSGADVRRPYVTGHVWKIQPIEPFEHGDTVFVELSHEVPTEPTTRAACLENVRGVIFSLMPNVSADRICFVAPPTPVDGHTGGAQLGSCIRE